ncbi:MAG: DUF1343 domain-containing protein [Bacteroidales bacterium]|nr:DUF1343 domain-containing protein [Bacteroidales bacterium]
MFSFRTTPIADQLDKSLTEGKVGCFCTQNCWDTGTGRYMWEVFRHRGNLAKLFTPSTTELTPLTSHFDFSQDELEKLNAVVVEIQDVGCRYFNYTRDVMRLLLFRSRMAEGPSIYIVDHPNPAGRTVEGSMPTTLDTSLWIPEVAHRHGLTLGELCSLYHHEIGADFPLHVISAYSCPSSYELMPWTIAPASDIPGFFTCQLYSGGGLWNNTSITPGIGTSRPYEYIGAPFIKADGIEDVPCPESAMMRPCSFTPSAGRYRDERCFGYQIMLKPGGQYHSLMHTLRLMRYFAEHYSDFEMLPELFVKIADPVIEEYLKGGITFDIVQEHIKGEEQKWIRKAKRFCLYDDLPCRIK